MQRIHNEQVREQKLRQYICVNSHELRDLEKKLNYAYTNKERSLQLEEKRLTEEYAKVALANEVARKIIYCSNERPSTKVGRGRASKRIAHY